MKSRHSYYHPTFDHFLQFHLGHVDLKLDTSRSHMPENLLDYLDTNSFPTRQTFLEKDVRVLDSDNPDSPLSLLCVKGESAAKAIPFLYSKILADYANMRPRPYGPIILTAPKGNPKLATYYDETVSKLFQTSVLRALYADPATMKISWYGRVNAHDQQRYLSAIIQLLMALPGISLYLTPHLYTQRGEYILCDSARSASLALSLMQQINPRASEGLKYTIAFACFAQHLGALVDEKEEYYPGKIYDYPNDTTLAVLEGLGIDQSSEGSERLRALGINHHEVLQIIRHRHAPPKKGSASLARIYCVALANLLVATYFTERTLRPYQGSLRMMQNPYFGDMKQSIQKLDASFADVMFYRIHRDKIASFLANSDRFYRFHTQMQMRMGAYVSEVAKKALISKAGKGKKMSEAA